MGIGIIDNRAPVQGSLNGKSGWISSLIVHPNYRKQGLGKETLNTLIKWFDMNYVSKIILHSTKEGEFFYNKLGFLKDNENIFIKTIY
ncbi:putative acetyltransferase [Staphylococcus capitis]|nr:putative acetyltransferase [Staphylococcus capitis]